MKKRYNFISRLINKITLNSQSNNDSFSYYGHWVELQSGTVDYMSVTPFTIRQTVIREHWWNFNLISGRWSFALMPYHAMKSMILL